MADTSNTYKNSQVRRVVSSGEGGRNEDMGTLSRLARNVAIGVPRAITDTLGGLDMLGDAVVAGVRAPFSDKTFAELLPEEMYGEKGASEINSYVSKEINRQLEQIPTAMHTKENINRIADAVIGSKAVHDIQTKNSSWMMRKSLEAGNAVNDAAGLDGVHGETTSDELAQFAGSLIVPTGAVASVARKAATKGMTSGIRRRLTSAAVTAAEAALPGRGAGGLAKTVGLNMGVGGAVNQGVRALTDQPSMITQDALAGDMGVTAEDFEANDTSGASFENMLTGTALMSTPILLMATLQGRVNRKNVMGSLTDEIEPSITEGQALKSKLLDGSSPIRDTVKNANVGTDKLELVERLADVDAAVHNATNSSVSIKNASAYNDGVIDGGRITPLRQIERVFKELDPADQELISVGVKAKRVLDERTGKTRNATERLAQNQMEQRKAFKENPQAYPDLKAKEKIIQQEIDDIESGASRGSFADMTIDDAKAASAALDANPNAQKVHNEIRSVYNQIQDIRVKQGHISSDDAIKLKQEMPNFTHMQSPAEKTDTTLKGYLNRMFTNEEARATFITNRAPVKESGDAKKIQETVDPISAMKMYVHDYVKYAAHNDAVKTFIGSVEHTPIFGKKEPIRDLYPSMSIEQFKRGGYASKVADNTKAVMFTDKGSVRVVEIEDLDVRNALKYNPAAVIPILNTTRKFFQQGTTGIFAPAFSFTAARLENGVAATARNTGRSYGPINTALMKVFPSESAMGQIVDRFGADPLAYPMALSSVFSQLSRRAQGALGAKIGEDLAAKSGIFNAMARTPEGKQQLAATGSRMLEAYNDSKYGQLVNGGMGHINLIDDASVGLVNDMTTVRKSFSDTASGKVIAPLMDGYLAMVESVHNSVKYTFFSQNYSLLESKFGKGKVPQREINKLIYETKTLSGDMTKQVGSDGLSRALSALPYSQVAVNATRHMARQISDRPDIVMPRIMMNSIMPKAIGLAVIGSSAELTDWYYNEIPRWQRTSTTPILGPSWWSDLATGNYRAPTKDDIYLHRQAPELVPLVETAMTGLRATGLLGKESLPDTPIKDIAEGFSTVSGTATPPLLSLMLNGGKVDLGSVLTAPFTGDNVFNPAFGNSRNQGINQDMNNGDSVISKEMSNSMVALFGNAAAIFVNAVEVGADAYDTSNDSDKGEGGFAHAFGKAMSYTGYENERRVAELAGMREIGASIFTNGDRRAYVTTPEREQVKRAKEVHQFISSQLSIENDTSGRRADSERRGLEGMQTIQDPHMLEIAKFIHERLGTKDMKAQDKRYSNVSAQMGALDNSKDKLNPAEYHRIRNEISEELQDISKMQAHMVNALQADLHAKYRVTLEDVTRHIKKSVGR